MFRPRLRCAPRGAKHHSGPSSYPKAIRVYRALRDDSCSLRHVVLCVYSYTYTHKVNLAIPEPANSRGRRGLLHLQKSKADEASTRDASRISSGLSFFSVPGIPRISLFRCARSSPARLFGGVVPRERPRGHTPASREPRRPLCAKKITRRNDKQE